MLIREIEQKKTNLRFKKVNDFETYIKPIDNTGYDKEDVNFTGWLYILNTPEFKKVSRSLCHRVTTVFKQDFVEFICNNCYIATSGNCFIKYFNYLTGKEYTEEFLTFIRTEQKTANVIASARVQPFRGKNTINVGCYDGFRVCPRYIAVRNIALYVHENQFCLIRKSQNISFNKATEDELEPNSKLLIMLYLTNMLKVLLNMNTNLEKVQSQLTNIIVYDIETSNTIKSVPYSICIYSLSKISRQ